MMVRGIERRPLFRDDRDRDDFVDRLARVAETGALAAIGDIVGLVALRERMAVLHL